MLFDVAITNALIIARANLVLQKQTKSNHFGQLYHMSFWMGTALEREEGGDPQSQ